MANSEHVAKLQEGIEVWNACWGQAFPPDLRGPDLSRANFSRADLREAYLCRADLREANLHGADLSGADFSRANLRETNLRGADLSGADFSSANLRETNLRGANLSGANFYEADLREAYLGGAYLSGADFYGTDLRGTDLREVNLSRANLSGANLGGAYLSGADLRGVNFAGVYLYDTIFANANLTDVKGLESCVHQGPSTIDHRTFERSGKLPLSFLRGCGLPNTFIDYLPSLLNQPIQFYSCFISYSSKDDDFAQRLYADLQNKGVRCWFAPEDMKVGDKIRTRIDEVIRIHDKLLLVLSRNSVASAWVEKEVETAFDREIERKEPVLFPIRLDAAVMESKTGWAADIRRSRHIGDFCNWKTYSDYQKGLERLLRDLQIEKDTS